MLTDISAVVWSTVDCSSFLVQIFEQTKETFFFLTWIILYLHTDRGVK